MLKPASGHGGHNWRVVWRFFVWPVVFVLASCAGTPNRQPLSFEPPAPETWLSPQSGGDDFAAAGDPIPGKSEVLLPGMYDPSPRPLVTLSMQGCKIKDRFDRKDTIAYNFSDGQSRLAFKLNMEGPSLFNPTNFEFKGAMLRFTYKLQPETKRKGHCLYSSPVQGLVGSVYNEMFNREYDTVWHELRARGLDF